MALLQRCKVLVVEDEYSLADDLTRALRSAGAHVIGPIGRLEEARARIKTRDFDVAVLDINLHDARCVHNR